VSSRAHLRFGSESPRAFSPLLDQSSVAPRTDRPDRSSRDSAQALHRPLEPAQFSRAGRRFRKTADGRRADVCYGRLVLRWGHPLLDYPRSRTPGFRGDRASSSQRTCVSSSPSRSNRPAVFTRSKGSDPHHIERRPKNTPHERPPLLGTDSFPVRISTQGCPFSRSGNQAAGLAMSTTTNHSRFAQQKVSQPEDAGAASAVVILAGLFTLVATMGMALVWIASAV